MTEKRFVETISTGIVTDTVTGKEYRCEMRIDEDLLKLLNKLNNEVKSQSLVIKGYQERTEKLFNENKQLKSELKELLVNSETVLEQKELQKIIYKMVYVAIDEKIEKAEEGFQQTQDNWYQGQIDALKELKKEL